MILAAHRLFFSWQTTAKGEPFANRTDGETGRQDRPMKRLLSAFLRNESGATAIEYGVVATLICVTAIASLGLLGDELDNVFGGIESNLATNMAGGNAVDTPSMR